MLLCCRRISLLHAIHELLNFVIMKFMDSRRNYCIHRFPFNIRDMKQRIEIIWYFFNHSELLFWNIHENKAFLTRIVITIIIRRRSFLIKGLFYLGYKSLERLQRIKGIKEFKASNYLKQKLVLKLSSRNLVYLWF